MKAVFFATLLSVLILTACGTTPPVTEVPQVVKSVTPSVTPTITLTSTPTLTPTATLTPTITPTPIGGGAGKIAFVSERDGNPEIYVMNSDGSGQTRLTNNPGDDNNPDWSPDGRKILFESTRNYTGEVYMINADGSGEINLTNNPQYFFSTKPKWSPDGKKIAFPGPNSDGKWGAELYVINADGSEKTRLTNNEYDDEYFEWSPDSKKIVFWSLRDKQGDIYVVNTDGSGELKLTNNPKYPNHISYNISPSWSPDGKTIIYMSENLNTPSYEIYAINPDGNNETRLTQTTGMEWLIAGRQMWSPNSKRIAFLYMNFKNNHEYNRICIINSDGSERVYLTDELSKNSYPRWSPDGKKIAFVSERDGQPEIYVMNADGSEQTRITFSNVYEHGLWQFQWAP